jgi:hypothetical protein
MDSPKTLLEAIQYFSDEQICINAVAAMRWPDGAQFSVKVNTIFEDSPIPLQKWLPALWLLTSCKNGVSSWEIHRSIGVSQKSAWFMLHRLRLALKTGDLGTKLGGTESGGVEVDETFVGGKLRNMHRDRRERFAAKSGHTGGATGKTIVMGILDRDARQVRASVVPDVKRETLQSASSQQREIWLSRLHR